MKSPYISLPNLLAERLLVPELIQDAATPESLAQHLARDLLDPAACIGQQDGVAAPLHQLDAQPLFQRAALRA